jgi:glucokinase
MQLFADIYASQLGNLALTYLPRGGLYIAGGIAPRILPLLRQSRFLDHFRNKPPMEALLDQIPVSVVTSSRTGLIGAYFRASELVEN